jgi:hypothetical protein
LLFLEVRLGLVHHFDHDEDHEGEDHHIAYDGELFEIFEKNPLCAPFFLE